MRSPRKLSAYKEAMLEHDFDVYAFVETNLDEMIGDAELFPVGFKSFRSDRMLEMTPRLSGGGVALAVAQDFSCEQLDLSVPTDVYVEFLCIRVVVANEVNVLLLLVYLPHWNHSTQLFDAVGQLIQGAMDVMGPADELVLLGDFNLSFLNWILDESLGNAYYPSNVTSVIEQTAVSNIFSSGLFQVCGVANQQGRMLDLVFCTDNEIVGVEQTTPLVSSEVYHSGLDVQVVVQAGNQSQRSDGTARVFCFERADFGSVNESLSNVMWSDCFVTHVDQTQEKLSLVWEGISPAKRSLMRDMLVLKHVTFGESIAVVECNAIILYLIIYDVLLDHVPYQVVKSRKFPVWFDIELRQSLCLKNKLYGEWKRSAEPLRASKYQAYSLARRSFKSAMKTKLDGHIRRIEENVKYEPKNFWNFVRSCSGSPVIPDVMVFDGVELNDPAAIADAFREFFQRNYQPFYGVCPQITPTEQLADLHFSVCLEEVLNALSGADVKKGAGPDLLAPLLFKRCAEVLAPPLTLIYEQCVSSGLFPGIWKMSYVVPIFKKGSKKEVANHRGVAIQSFAAKLLENLLDDQVTKHAGPVVSRQQHGFVSNRSTVSNLLEFNLDVKRSMEAGLQTDAFYVDFAKAFDRVPHGILAIVLDAFGMRGATHDLLMSYLTERKQFVKVKGEFSSEIVVNSGVPQGSHIGPTLFVLFVDSLPACVTVKGLGYADDFKFYKTVGTLSDCVSLQEAIDATFDWSGRFGLDLSIDKCMVMTHTRRRNPVIYSYSLGGEQLTRVREFVDLGVRFDEKGTFKSHVSTKAAKGMAMLGFVRRTCVKFKDSFALRAVFSAHVRSHVEYASAVWIPHHDSYSSCIERVQRRFTRYAVMKSRACDYDSVPGYHGRCQELGLQQLVTRRRANCAVVAFDILTGRTDSHYLRRQFVVKCNRDAARHVETFVVPHRRTNYGKFEPIALMTRMMNGIVNRFSLKMTRLPDGMFSFGVSREQFKHMSMDYFLTDDFAV